MPGSANTADTCDIAIVGGGMVGASLAAALAPLKLDVVVIEAVPPTAGGQPSFDARTTALSNGSRRILEGLGVWREVAREASVIERIHVSEQGRFGSAVIDAREQGLAALGFVLENRVLGTALWSAVAAAGTTRVISPATVTGAALGAERVALTLDAAGFAQTLNARLVVAADGAGSLVRTEAGVGAERWDYGQTAIITTLAPGRFHERVAYERFTPTGPIALLPLTGGRVGVVWSLAPEAATRVLTLPPETFLAELQRAVGWRLGRLGDLGARHAYPLALTRAAAQSAPRIAIMGNAAQGLHPIAGQGFNLGLRDAATLAEVIADAGGADPGGEAVLGRYVEWRQADRRALIAFTDGLVRLFASPFAPVGLARGLGLVLFDLSPVAKTAMSRLSLGFAARLPRLARGLAITAPASAESGAP